MARLVEAPNQDCVLIRDTNGIAAIPRSSPLRRLHYFDGKFLRAEHLTLEQDYQRRLVEASNQAGGAGVVYGLDCTRAGNDELEVGPGMAIDPPGRVILLPQNQVLSITELIECSRRPAAPGLTEKPIAKPAFGECELGERVKPGIVQDSTDLYLITVGHTEACCGTEDVYGKLCEEACVTSTSRPYIIEGVVFRAEPLPPEVTAPLLTPGTRDWSANQLRSRVASAYFRYYDQGVNDGAAPPVLTTGVACLGAHLPGGENVPIALLARQGCTTLFLDAWMARRERLEAPARTYWAGCLHLRPGHVFLAQVLQFQCHLNALFPEGEKPAVARDPCRETRGRVVVALEQLLKTYVQMPVSSKELLPKPKDLQTIVSNLNALGPSAFSLANQVLIQGGIVELPSAGYLPVDAKSAQTVNAQVRRLLGDGPDLRFCVVRPDYIPHAFEEAQHLERINLLQGLRDPRNKPEVDILVPNGEPLEARPQQGMVFEGTLLVSQMTEAPADEGGGSGDGKPATHAGTNAAVLIEALASEPTGSPATTGALPPNQVAATPLLLCYQGIGRTHTSGGWEFYFAGRGVTAAKVDFAAFTADSKLSEPDWDSFLECLESERVPQSKDMDAVRGASESGTEPSSALVDEATVRPATRAAAGKVAKERPSTRDLGSIWAEMWSQSDPFDLQERPIRMGFRWVIQLVTGKVVDLRRAGTFQVQKRGKQGAVEMLSGTFDGRQTIEIAGAESGARSAPLTLPVVLARCLSPDGGGWWILKVQRGRQIFRLNWRVVPGGLAAVAGYPEPVFLASSAGAVLKQNSSLAAPGNATRTLIEATLKVLSKQLGDEHFFTYAKQRLFPKEESGLRGIEVRARHDWVLFHRRRHKECEAEPVAPVLPPAREYKVFHVQAESLEKIKEALAVGSVKDFEFIDYVTFAPDAAELASPAGVLQDRWSGVSAGNKLLYAAIASTGAAAAEDDELARERVKALVKVLPLATAWDDAPPEVLEQVPAGLDPEDKDGVCLLVTNKTTCLSVYAAAAGDIGKLQAQKTPDKVLQELKTIIGPPEHSRPLGKVEFDESNQMVERTFTTVRKNWTQLVKQAPGNAVVISEALDHAAADYKRAVTIHKNLDGSGEVARMLIAVDMPEPVRCRAILFLSPKVVGLLRVFYRSGTSANLVAADQPGELRYREDGTAELHLPDNATAELANRVVTDIIVHRPQNPPDEAARAATAEAVATTLRASGLTVEGPGTRHEISEVERGLLPNDIGPNDHVVILRTKPRSG